jgi:purine-binding chemotaxis protein CheW
VRTLYLIAELDGQRIAIEAAHIDSVVHVARVTPVPLMPPHLLGLAALRSRVITMIDCRAALGLMPVPAARLLVAVVVDVEGHQYGLTVDRVEDVREIEGAPSPVRARLGAGWAAAARGVIDDGEASLLLLDPAALVAGQPNAKAA